jgi:hypothetical protein
MILVKASNKPQACLRLRLVLKYPKTQNGGESMVEYNENVTINAPYKLILKNTDSWWVDLRCLQNVIDAPGILEVSGHIKCLKDIAAYGGALMTASAPGSTGGGAVNMGHGWEGSTDPPRINMTDDGYHTLYITAGSSVGVGADAVLADMKLKKLTATDGAKLNAVAIGRDEYGDIPYEYESIQLNPAHNLRFCFGTNERMMLSNAGRLELPVPGSSGGLKIGGDVNLYRSDTDILKTNDSFAVGEYASISSLGDAIFNSVKGTSSSGAIKAGDELTLAWGGDYGVINCHNRHLKIVTGSGKNMYLDADGAYIYISIGNALLPEGANAVNIGTNILYFGSVWANYLKYRTSCTQFDALDDLALVKNYKSRKEDLNGTEIDVIDMEKSFPFLVDDKGFKDPAQIAGFLLGCVKQLVLRVEAVEARLRDVKAG